MAAAAAIFAATVDIKKQFGLRVKMLRQMRGLSQEDLAGLCDLHPTYISGIERGKRNVSLENIKAIAMGLGIPIADLFATIKR